MYHSSMQSPKNLETVQQIYNLQTINILNVWDMKLLILLQQKSYLEKYKMLFVCFPIIYTF